MKLTTRRNIAIVLILIGLIALLFGLWILWSSFFGKSASDLELPGRGDLVTTPKEQQEPQVIELPVTVEGTSTLTAEDKSSDLQAAINRASAVVSRMGSGSSQSGFLGYGDVLIDSTERFKSYVLQEQRNLQIQYPADGALYGLTTRIVSADIVRGQEGGEEIIVKVQSQVTADVGDRSKPTKVWYEEKQVTLKRQADGVYLVDYIETKAL